MVGNRRERGFAAIFAIGAIALMTGAVLLAADHLQARYQGHQTELRDVRLIAHCDAVIAETLASMNADAGFAGVARRGYDGGTISSRVRYHGDGAFTMVAVSTTGNWSMEYAVSGRMTPEGPVIDRWSRRLKE